MNPTKVHPPTGPGRTRDGGRKHEAECLEGEPGKLAPPCEKPARVRDPKTIQYRFFTNIVLTMGMFLVLANVFLIYVYWEKQIDRANDVRIQSLLLAHELRQSSDDLTRMVRSYVATGDPIYKQHYLEILDIRDGKRPRPVHYENVYWDLVLSDDRRPSPAGEKISLLEMMRRAGFTEAELAKLAQAKANSDQLTHLEFAAMALVESPLPVTEDNRLQAVAMLYGTTYRQAKAGIMRPIGDFSQQIDRRTLSAVEHAKTMATILRVLFAVLSLLLIFLLWRVYRALHAILGCPVEELYRSIARLGSGDLNFPIPARQTAKNSILSWVAATQLNLTRLDAERQQVQQALSRNENLFRAMLDASPLSIILTSRNENLYKFINSTSPQLFGYSHEEIGALETWWPAAYPDPRYRAWVKKEWARRETQAIETHRPLEPMETEVTCKDGSKKIISWGMVTVDEWKMVFGLDLTERKRMEKLLLESEERYRTAFQTSIDAIVISRMTDGQYFDVNQAFQEIFGFRREEVLGKTSQELHIWANAQDRAKMVETLSSGTSYRNCEARYRRKDGSLFWGRTSASKMVLNGLSCIVAMTRDISEQKEAEEEIRKLAYFDPLTCAWNRRHFEEVVVVEMHRSHRYGQPLSLMMLDIDHFKRVNDAFGHASGDTVLRQVVERARGEIRLSDSLTRWGGEEFIVLMPNTNLASATILAERIRKVIGGRDFDPVGQVTASLGVAEYLPPAALEPWLERADQALYRAKHGGRNQVVTDPTHPSNEAAAGHPMRNFSKLVWSNTYRCGNPAIDGQHENLFHIANELFDAMYAESPEQAVSPVVDRLLSEIGQHFQDEEAILAELRFPGFKKHKQKHASLLAQARELASAFLAGTLTAGDLFQFLSHQVIAQHLLKADREYFNLVQAGGKDRE